MRGMRAWANVNLWEARSAWPEPAAFSPVGCASRRRVRAGVREEARVELRGVQRAREDVATAAVAGSPKALRGAATGESLARGRRAGAPPGGRKAKRSGRLVLGSGARASRQLAASCEGGGK
eukprot:GHVT01087362.1.p3 GENE.GHVT01087362.1~~GHVT01087362.1.p3  ORF type:complete len:122 (+),score=22.27 GHVT01087362.1:432-797(+)